MNHLWFWAGDSLLESFFGMIAETRFEKQPGKRVHRSQTAKTASVNSVFSVAKICFYKSV
jgi:hypothetical protein